MALVIDNDEATADYWWICWGVQSRYYDASANAALFYEAEGRTAMGGSAIAAGPSGASGAGSNVMRNTALSTSYQAILSTQATAAGAHLSHVGSFRVFARVQTPTGNTGAVSVALEWGEGDYRRVTRNVETTFPFDLWEGTWRLVDLGQVHLPKVAAGTQRWEGRIVAKSTVPGDDIDVDCLMLVPVDEGSGVAQALPSFATPSAFSSRDEFGQTAGALAGKVAAVGGTWAGAGSGSDFTVDATAQTVTRAIDDTSVTLGRFDNIGSATFTDVLVQADLSSNVASASLPSALGVYARYVDANNWLIAYFLSRDPGAAFRVTKKVASSITTIYDGTFTGPIANLVAGTWHTIRLVVDAKGRYWVWFGDRGSRPAVVMSGVDADLATGGALATGKAGIYDGGTSTAVIRSYDNHFVAVPVADAAIFASQSLELRSDQVIREDSGGTLWQRPSNYEGDYPRIPPAGKEARSVRVIVIPSRHDPATMPHDFGDLSFRMTVTPRYLQVPA